MVVAAWFTSGHMVIQLTSTAFVEGQRIPKAYTCDGEDRSPPLAWSDLPPDTESLALICDDPDAPTGTWVHWVVYNIPPDARGFAEGVPDAEILPNGAQQGTNDFRRIGYGGPCPPRGSVHRYHFKLYALDSELALPGGITKAVLEDAMDGHILAEGRLIGIYQRQ
jgi:Raf kinase inhibitor-like YbhB/YbcL family protein